VWGLCFVSLWVALGGGLVPAFATPAPESSTAARARSKPESAPRVLVLYSGDRLLRANQTYDASVRRTLAAGFGGAIEFFSEFLDEQRFPDRFEERMGDFLQAKYGSRPPDVIIAIGSPSLDLCLRYRDQLFEDVPIVFAAKGTDRADEPVLGPRITGVRSSQDAPATLRMALRLNPRTQQLYVVGRSATGDSADAMALWSQVAPSAPNTTFHWLPNHPLPLLLSQLSHLPEHSVVLYLSTLDSGVESGVDAGEVEQMSTASRAPLYAIVDTYVGSGAVGAVTTPKDSTGRKAAELALAILASGSVDALPPVETLPATPLFDWRQVRRWGIHGSQLPPGSVVLFRSPSLLRQHYKIVILLGGLFLLQSGLILALVLQSRRRRIAEREELRQRQELAHMTRVATMGELTASLAHEINQPLAAILTNAQAAQRLLANGTTDMEEIREILDDIATADQHAGEVIRRMRALLRKGGSEPAVLDVNGLVNEVVGLVRGELILQNVELALDLSPGLPRVHGDRVQLQQVLLNLVVNAVDAMKEVSTGSRRLVVRTSSSNGRVLDVAVEDSGVGVPPEAHPRIFEPFFTSKAHGLGLGLSICRSIVQAHGGRIRFENNAGRGVTFSFTLPGVEEVQR
jgi:signal transduction histidine kinase